MDSAGWTPLHIAVAAGDIPAVREFLAAGADPVLGGGCRGHGTTAHTAARAGDCKMLEVLLEAQMGGDRIVNSPDALKRTPLHFAVVGLHADCVSLLLRYRADPSHRDGEGAAPLDLVPQERPLTARVTNLLKAYLREEPKPKKFHLPGLCGPRG